MIQLYGIPNCDTVKKARTWLQEQSIQFEFIDFKKQAPTAELITSWLQTIPLETLLNKRGTTWRKLTNDQKQAADASVNNAIYLLIENTSMIKRPIVEGQLADKNNGQPILLCGFDEAEFEAAFL